MIVLGTCGSPVGPKEGAANEEAAGSTHRPWLRGGGSVRSGSGCHVLRGQVVLQEGLGLGLQARSQRQDPLGLGQAPGP